jgi:hypothetical protein
MKHSIKIFALLAIFLAPAFVACDDNDDFEAQYSANYPSVSGIVSMVLELDRNPDLD